MKWPWKKQSEPKFQFKDPRRGYPPLPEPEKPVKRVEIEPYAPPVVRGYDIFGCPIYGPDPRFYEPSLLSQFVDAILDLITCIIAIAGGVFLIWFFFFFD